MNGRLTGAPAGAKHGGQTLRAILLVVQAMAAVFFIVDVVADFAIDGADFHNAFEALIAVALTIGVVLGAIEMRRALDRASRAETALKAASGALAELIDARFEEWALTPAEREVAMLALKGFDIAEIAGLRGAATGTVRAQLARVYAKSGASGRAQFVALFVEDLLAGPVADARPAAVSPRGT